MPRTTPGASISIKPRGAFCINRLTADNSCRRKRGLHPACKALQMPTLASRTSATVPAIPCLANRSRAIRDRRRCRSSLGLFRKISARVRQSAWICRYRSRQTVKSFARHSAVARRGLKGNRVITGVALDESWRLPVLDRLLLSQKTQVSGNCDKRDCLQVQLDPEL